MRLNALCEESSHWETGPNGTILVSGIGEIGARRAFEAMCYFDSLMRPRWLEMLHRNCWQSSPPAQNPRPASRFRLDKRDEVVGPCSTLPNEVAAYNDYQRQRLLVKPGMTCYWQTRRNRDSITFDEWVGLDL